MAIAPTNARRASSVADTTNIHNSSKARYARIIVAYESSTEKTDYSTSAYSTNVINPSKSTSTRRTVGDIGFNPSTSTTNITSRIAAQGRIGDTTTTVTTYIISSAATGNSVAIRRTLGY